MPKKVVERFEVSHLQILDPDGNVDPELEPELGQEQLLAFYRSMLLARRADDRMLKLQRQGRIGTFAPCTGQEAAVVGPAFAMNERDWFVGSFRELAGRLVREDTILNRLQYFNGFEEGNLLPSEKRRVLPISVIVGSQTLHAVGIAYAMKYQQEDAAVVVFCGDGATSEEDFHEALNFAAVWEAPVVFVVQNNQWAISIPRSQQTRSRSIAQKAIAYGMPGLQVDGNDVLATYEATREALARARAGDGPTLIEAVTYRLMMHTTADDPRKYRTEQEVEEQWAREPLVRFRRYLEQKGYWNDAQQEALEEELKAEIDAGVREFEEPREYKPDAAFDHVYGTRHEVIEEQRRTFLDELSKEVADA